METVSPSRKTVLTSVAVVVVVLLLYVGSYCWLRLWVAQQIYVSPSSALFLADDRWMGFNDRLNFIFKPLLLADTLISRRQRVLFVGEYQ